MHKARAFFLLPLMFLSALGCSLGRRTINGQVFIATQGGESVKLGMVEVVLLPENSVMERVAAREAEFKNLLAEVREANAGAIAGCKAINDSPSERARVWREKLQPELREKETRLAQAEVWVAEAERAHNEAESARWTGGESGGGSAGLDKLNAAAANLARAHEAQDLLRDQCAGLLRRLSHVPDSVVSAKMIPEPTLSHESYFQTLYLRAVAKTQTDADGRFSLAVPRSGRFMLAAQSARKLLNTTETYFWLVKVPDSAKQGTPVLLCNSSLLPEGVPLSTLFAKP